MLNYSNGFSIASDEDRKTFIIHMLQEFPELTDEGTQADHTKTQVIGSYVIERDVALRLASAIVTILDDDNDDDCDTEDE